MLDTTGKLFAKIIQMRPIIQMWLHKVVEDILPDSQCAFRSGRGCVDMIFSAQQLVVNARGHYTKMSMLFVDLHKAYDAMPRQALWLVLHIYSVLINKAYTVTT